MRYTKAPKGFPSRFRICDQVWRVLYSPELVVEEGKLGVTSPTKQTITLDATVTPPVMRRILGHEILHACFTTQEDAHQLTHDQEEQVVKVLGPALLSALKRNAPWW